VQRVQGLRDDQIMAWEARLEAQMVESLQAVMDKIAARIAKIQTASARVLVAVATTGPDGDDDPPPMTAELEIPAPVPQPETIPATPDLPPGQPYISPDDLASIPPLWQQAVADQLLPLAAEVFVDSALKVRAEMIDALPLRSIPALGSLAAEQYLAQAKNTFEQVGDHLWATARAQLSQGFEAGESIPQLADRLRQSAGLSARTGVLVARTQVIEASNSGSIAMARVSGIEMLKEWIATPDLRTRPTHLAADGQRVALSAPFLVGGFTCDFPAAPNLPPSERYSCRCTQGYVIPDREKAPPRADPLTELPGTSAPATIDDLAAEQSARLGEIIDDQHQQLEAVIDDVHERFQRRFLAKPAGPGFDQPAYGDHPPGYVRPSLQAAKTPRQLRKVWQDEVQAVTGYPFFVDAMPRGISMATAREYAEGTLQMFAQFPAAKMDRIHWFDEPTGPYARVRTGGHAIEINMRYAAESARSRFLASRRKDVVAWETRPTAWSVRNDVPAQGVIYHEFAHIIDEENLRRAIHPQLVPLMIRHAQREGVTDIDDLIKRRVSTYATESHHELIAEATTDVMVNGSAASAMSREIFDLMRAEYRRRGYEIRDAAPDLDADLAAEAEAAGNVFPKAPSLASRTVADLRALARERGITVPAGTRKADLVRLLDESPPGPAVSAPAVRSARSITDLANETPIRVTPLEGGVTAKVERLDFAGGDSAVRKDYMGLRSGGAEALRDADHRVSSEVLAADVLRAVGVRAPAVVRLNDHTLLMDFVAGDQGGADGVLKAPAAIVRSAEGRRLGLADAIMGHRDRAGGNWMRAPDGGIVAIDNGGAFGGVGADRAAAGNPFTSFLMGPYEESPWKARIELPSDIDLAEIRRKLLALRPRFDDAGFQRQFKDMLGRLDEVGRRAVRVPPAPRLAPDVDLIPGAPGPASAPVAGPRLATMKVGELRDLARARGIPDAAKLRKADLVKALEASGAGPDLADVARTRQAVIDDRRAVATALSEASELLANGASERALGARSGQILGRVSGQVADDLAPLATAMRGGDAAAIRTALDDLATRRGLRPVVPDGDAVPFDAKTMELLPGTSRPPAGTLVRVVRLGYEVDINGETVQLGKAVVDPLSADEIAAVQRRATRAAARERNRLIESRAATARLLASVDELVAKGASRSAIRERLDPALRQAEQEFAGADDAVAKALLDALETGDTAKLKSAITRSGTSVKIKAVSKAGAKAKFDPDTMEAVGGVDIPAGAAVQVVRRGSTLTLPDGEVITLSKPQVTVVGKPTAQAAPAARLAPGESLAERTQAVARLQSQTPTAERQLGGGLVGEVDMLTYPDGIRAVRKRLFGRRAEATAAQRQFEIDAEVFGPSVLDAVSVRAPGVVRSGDGEILMEFLDGDTFASKYPDFGYGNPEHWDVVVTAKYADTADGRMIGLADYLMGNTDRNAGNWIIQADGSYAGIDHGYAFLGQRGTDVPSGFFTRYLHDGPSKAGPGYVLRSQVDLNPADLAVVRSRLAAQRAQYVEAGRKTWHDAIMRRLREVEKRADPAAPVRIAGLAK